MQLYYSTISSLRDELERVRNAQNWKFVVGAIIVYLYVWTMIGSCNAVEHRTWLSLIGITTVGLGIFTSYGICQFMHIYSTPMHKILPFLVLGIGIDDMFVIIETFAAVNYRRTEG